MAAQQDRAFSSPPSMRTTVPRLAAGTVTLIGFAVLYGWAFDIWILKSVQPGLVEMKPNTAVGFILMGASLWLSAAGAQRSATACALIAALLGLFVVVEFLAGWNLGIDELLFRDNRAAPDFGPPPGRMAFATAASFLALGTVLIGLNLNRGATAAQFVASAVGLVALISLLGYLFEETAVYIRNPYTCLALPTSVAFAVLAVGILSVHPNRGPLAVPLSDGPGGYLARRLVPVIIVVTIGLTWLVLKGSRTGYYRLEFGISLLAALEAVILGVVVWATALALDRADLVRRGVEHDLQTGNELLRAVTDGTTDAVFVKDRNGRYLLVNPATARFLGRPVDAVLGQDDTAVFDADSARRVRAWDRRIIESGAAETTEETLTSAGVTRTYMATKAPYRDKDGAVIGLIGISRDVTEQRRLAAERDALLARLQLHVERMPLCYILFDADFRVTDWNPAAERTLGFTRAEALGKEPFDLIPPAARDQAAALLARVRAGDMTAHALYENRTRDGRTITCEWFNTPLMEAGGRFTGLLCLGQDVTHRAVLEQQLRQAQKMEAVGQLAAGVAHDFNNLLTVISGYSFMVQSTLPAGDPNWCAVEEINRAGERAALLTRQLLTFSRKEVVAPKVLDLNAVIDTACRMLRRLIGEDVHLATALAPDLDRVRADAGHLEQVLMNLAVNARDAMPTGGQLTVETANVDLGAEYAGAHAEVAPGRYVLLAVADTGVGMTEDVKARIFEPFFTTKGVGKGTGLGLSTVFGVVKQSGGHVAVYSEAGRGTTFKVYLPSAGTGPGAGAPAPAPAVPRGSGTVLVVEDDEQVRGLTQVALESLGYTVLEARDGETALRICAGHTGPIDLLVTDVVMPGLSGRQVAERLERLRPGIEVLYVSGYTDDAVVRHGVLEAEAAFLQKPFTPASLGAKIREVLNGR